MLGLMPIGICSESQDWDSRFVSSFTFPPGGTLQSSGGSRSAGTQYPRDKKGRGLAEWAFRLAYSREKSYATLMFCAGNLGGVAQGLPGADRIVIE